MLRSVLKTFSALLASSSLLAACGGGGDSASIASSVATQTSGTGSNTSAPSSSSNTGSNTTDSQNNQGVAFPTTVISSVFDGKNDSGQPVTILVQDDGSYFIVSSDTESGKPSRVMLGTGTLNNGSFASSNGLDLTLVGIGRQELNAFSLSASYTEKSKLNGNISYAVGNQTASFTGDYNSSYETLPDLTAFAGVYTGSIANKDMREDNIILMISSDGKLAGQLSCGCAITSQMRVQENGTAYAATLDFRKGSNPLTGTSLSGNVYLDSATQRLYIVGKMTGTGDQVVFVGTKS